MAERKIKVMYVIGSMESGGAERHLLEVIRNLDRSRFEPSLCCISDSGVLEPEFRATGIKIGVFRFRGIYKRPSMVWQLVLIFFFIVRQRPEIIHTYLYWANIVGGMLGRLARRPVLITSRRGMGTYKDRDRRLQTLENYVNSFTDIVTVNSLGVRRDVVAREKLDHSKIWLIYNGVSTRFSHGTPSDAAKLWQDIGITPGVTVIGCVANIRWYKGYADLVEAFARVHRAVPDTVLVCVGEDSGIVPELQQQAEALGCGEAVLFPGARNDVHRILPLFDIQVLASHEEGFSNAVLEGMAAGNPMVVTDVGGNAEAIQDGVHGLVVPPREPERLAEAILTLLADRPRAKEMGRLASERVRSLFTIPAMVGQMEELYLEQLASKRPGLVKRVSSNTQPM